MRPDPKAAFLIGLATLLLFVGIGVAFAFDPGLFSRRVVWLGHFGSVASLDEGAPIYENGLIIGRVGNRQWQPQTQDFLVELRLDPGWTSAPGHSMRIEQSNPLQGAYVAAVEGPCDGMHVPPKAPGLREVATCPRLPGLFDVAGSLLARIYAITEQVQTLVGGSGDAQAAQRSRIEQVADNLTALSLSLRTLVDQLGTLQPELKQALVSTRTLTSDADHMVRQTDDMLQHVRRDTLVRVDHTLDSTDQLVRGNAGTIQTSLGDVRYILGASSGSIVHLAVQVDTIAANLAELTRQLRDNPGALLRGRSLDDPPGTRAARP